MPLPAKPPLRMPDGHRDKTYLGGGHGTEDGDGGDDEGKDTHG